MSILKRPINYVGLENELEESLKADTKYQLENNAKLRAIEQNVPTYEHFRQMVNGAHLKPLEHKDTNEKSKVSWNLLINKNENTNNQMPLIKNSSFSIENKERDSYGLSKSAQEFYKKWKTMQCIDDKINFLFYTRDLLPDIFQLEIPTNVLGEFLNVCLNAITIKKNNYLSLMCVIDILTSLTMCNRFQLAINFMTIHDKSICQQLFVKILLQGQNEPVEISRIIELGEKFDVKL